MKIYNNEKLKFRYWNEEIKKMELKQSLIGLKIKNIMQFTGKYDYSGEEVYVGDIIEISICDGNSKEIMIGQVTWDEDHLQFGILGDGDGQLCDYEDKDISVIGNVIENYGIFDRLKR